MDWIQYDWRELNSISPQELTGDTDAPCRMPRTIDQYMEMCSEDVNQDVFLASFTGLWKHQATFLFFPEPHYADLCSI